MKKILLFFAAVLIGSAVFSQNIEVNPSAKTDTLVVVKAGSEQSQQLSRDIYMDVKSAIVSMTESLKVGADHVYGVLVKQQYINSWILVMGWLGWLLLVFTFIVCLKQNSKNGGDDDMWIALCIVSGILTVIIGIVCVVFFGDMITGFTNPEYNAIKEILDAVNK